MHPENGIPDASRRVDHSTAIMTDAPRITNTVFAKNENRLTRLLCRGRRVRLSHKGQGHTGGCMCRSKPQLTFANHLCCFTSLAPLLLPSRVRSSLSSSRVMQSLPALISSIRNISARSQSSVWPRPSHVRNHKKVNQSTRVDLHNPNTGITLTRLLWGHLGMSQDYAECLRMYRSVPAP
jgi:hypothetical protein